MAADLKHAGVVLLLLAGLRWSSSAVAQEPPADPVTPSPDGGGDTRPTTPAVHGSLSLRYDLRATDRETDHDLVGLLSLDVGEEATEPVTVHFLGRLSGDLDGQTDPAFRDITDSFSQDVNGRVYDAYLDFHRVTYFDTVRLGRQTLYETPFVVTIDGAQVQTEGVTRYELKVGAYGGLPTHLYESSPEGDWTVGAHVEGRPWSGGRARVDWMHVTDETGFAENRDDLLGVALWQTIHENLQLHARYNWLEGQGRDWQARATLAVPEWTAQLQLSYYELLRTQRAQAIEFDPFSQAAFAYFPYRQYRATATKDLGEHASVQAGADLRRLRSSTDEARFNREFERFFLTPSVHDVVVAGLSASLTGEVWSSRGGEDIASVGGELRQEISADLDVYFATSYALYQFDLFANREKERVRTYAVGADGHLREDLRLRLEYAYERDTFDRYHSVKVGLTWRF